MGNAFPSKWLKAVDITRPIALTIDRVTQEPIAGSQKFVVYFRGVNKGLILKPATNNALVSAFGRNSDSWRGKRVTLTTGQVQFQGKWVPTIVLQTDAPPVSAPLTTVTTLPPTLAPAPANVGDALSDVFGGDGGESPVSDEPQFTDDEIPF